MKIKELLSTIAEVAQRIGTSTPFVCGGTPRDKLLNRTGEIVDLDITTGDESIHLLGRGLARFIPNANYQQMSDGHGQLMVEGFKVDLSSNFRVPGVKEMLQQAGIANPTNMQCELYSRDFTCNALLLTMNLKTIHDPTGLGLMDINRKKIRTCLPAAMTLGSQHKRVVRVFYLAAKLGFDVDDEIVRWVRANPQSISDAKPKFVAEKLQKALDSDKEKTVRLLDEMGLWKYIPALPDLLPYMNSPGRI